MWAVPVATASWFKKATLRQGDIFVLLVRTSGEVRALIDDKGERDCPKAGSICSGRGSWPNWYILRPGDVLKRG